MSENKQSIQYLAEKAVAGGYETFTHVTPCKRCKTFERYSRGRSGCVKCAEEAKKIYRRKKVSGDFTQAMLISAKYLSVAL